MEKKSVVLILFFFIIIACVFANNGQKSVLLINSYNFGYHWTDEVSNGVESFFSEFTDVMLYAEYLDSKRFPDKQNWVDFLYFINSKYANKEIDAIIVSDNDALNFVLENSNFPLFANLPVVACGISNTEDYIHLNNLYLVQESELYRYDFKLLTKLFPDIEELVFITDHLTTGTIYKDDVISIFENDYPHIRLKIIDCIELETFPEQLRALRYPTVVYHAGVLVDCNNQSLNDLLVTQLIQRNVTVPLFSGYYCGVVDNFIGGLTSKGESHGQKAASIVYQLWFDTVSRPDKIHYVEIVPIFDYLLLKKYDVDIESLPANTVFVNKPDNFLIKNKRILIIGTLIIINLLLVIGLLYRSVKIQKAYRKKLQIEMEKASMSNRVKTIFLENVSHEMRTPLNSIVGFSDVLLEAMPESQEKNFLKIISENALIMNNIISQIFDFSLLKSHRVELNISSFELTELIDSIIKNEKFDVKLEQKSIVLQIDFSSTDGKIPMQADFEKIYQVLKHIIGNAVKFTPKGSIEIIGSYSKSNNPDFSAVKLVNKRDSFVLLGVFDSGIGISESYFDQLFEPFSHDNEKDTNANRGLGLGLSISKLIIEIMGGQIKVKSIQGKGTQVLFTLPVNIKT